MANAGTDGGAGGPDSPEAPQPVFCHMCQVVTHAARGEGGEPACARCSGSFIEYVEGEETMQEEEPQPDPGEEPMDPFHQLLSQYMHMVASQQQEGGSTQSQSSEQRNSESSSSSQQHGGMPGSLQALLSQMLSSNMSNAINAIQGGGPVLSFGDYILDGDLDRIASELGRQNPVPSAQQVRQQCACSFASTRLYYFSLASPFTTRTAAREPRGHQQP